MEGVGKRKVRGRTEIKEKGIEWGRLQRQEMERRRGERGTDEQ